MRYYKIVVGDKTFTSYAGGKNIPGALNVVLDIPVFPFAQPSGAAWAQIWGISIQDIGQASDLNGKDVSIYGGFQKGLPLANPSQAGLLVKGKVFQAFGNWIDTRQTIDLIIYPDTGTNDAPKNIVLNWKKGTKFADALNQTLTTAFPDFSVDVKVSDNLVIPADEVGYYSTLTQFAQYAKAVSKEIIGGTEYAGVDIMVAEDSISVYDGTSPTDPMQIAFQDMIGQPTWIDPLSVQVKLAMRADLQVGDYIKFPPSIVTTSSGTTSPFVDAKSTFQGVFQVGQVRHVGNFRQPNADSWVTVVNAYSAQAAK